MLELILMIFTVAVVFSVVILLHEFGHFITARRLGVRVERFSLGFGKVLWSVKKGECEYAISAIPFGGYIKMSGEEPSDKREGRPWEFYAKPPGKRFWILFAGAAFNYIFAFLLFCFISPTARVGMVLEDMPAYKSGIRPQDRIISIDGKGIRYWYELKDIVSKDIEAKPLKFKLERKGEVIDLAVTPKILESKDIFGKDIKTAKIGIGYYGDVVFLRASPWQNIKVGMRQTLDNSYLTYKIIWYLITRKVPLKGTVSGPVFIVTMLGKAVKVGFAYLIYLVAHINLALAIFNLLPFPVLDGGHIIFLGLEKIRRRPIAPKTQEIIQYAAITLLIALMIFVTYNDIIMLRFLK